MPVGFIHDFDPAIAQVFGLHLYWYGAVYTVGFLGIFGWFVLRRAHLGLSMADVLDLSIALALGVLLGGRIFDILVYEFDYYRGHSLHALDWWRGGLATHGVLLGSLASLYVFCRRHRQPFLRMADELTVPAAFLLCVGRIGNFIEGGVIGTATEMPWGVHYPDIAGPRHPVALYESAKNLLIVPALVLALRRTPAGRGVALALFVFLYSGLRFLVDLLRDYEAYWFGLDTGQYFNLLMATLGIGMLIWAQRRADRPGAAPPPRPTRAGRVGWLRPITFALLCLYPLGIPTSWTQVNIEEKRQVQTGDQRRGDPILKSALAITPASGRTAGSAAASTRTRNT
jgi:phosphatidylglycerol:prolipoprotein diacylglycerol transferase